MVVSGGGGGDKGPPPLAQNPPLTGEAQLKYENDRLKLALAQRYNYTNLLQDMRWHVYYSQKKRTKDQIIPDITSKSQKYQKTGHKIESLTDFIILPKIIF